jgi:GntR family transcriptional regulator
MSESLSTDLPKYLQVSETLMRDIGAGILADGARLPPERDLAAELDVSVGTLRKALAEIESRGMLQRIHGSGNYVRAGKPTDSIYGMFRLELPGGGGLPRAEFLHVCCMQKPMDIPRFGTSDTATRMRRLRSLDRTVIAVEEIWLDASVGDLRADMVTESLYHTYRNLLGVDVTRAVDSVSVGAVPDWAPASFGMRADAVCGFIERYSWAAHAAPVEYSRTWFDPSRATYVQRLG